MAVVGVVVVVRWWASLAGRGCRQASSGAQRWVVIAPAPHLRKPGSHFVAAILPAFFSNAVGRSVARPGQGTVLREEPLSML